MELYNRLYKRIIYPGYHLIKNDGFLDAEKQARNAEKLTDKDYLQLQNHKITLLLRFIYLNVPFYKKCFLESGVNDVNEITSESIGLLPIINKAIISKNPTDFISNNILNNTLYDNSTSGSSGYSFRFKTDIKSFAHRAAIVERTYRQIGIQRGDKEAMLWGAKIDISRSNSIRGWLHSRLTRRLMLSSYAMTEQDLLTYVDKLNKFKPKLLTSYPGPLECFARFCIDNGMKIPSLKAIITSAEMLYPHQRELFESAFGVRVYNRYGCREFGCIAQETDVHGVMPVHADRLYVEILRENGENCDVGEVGNIVITDLDNFGMPFVRYQVGDCAAWAKTDFSKHEVSSLTRLEGRSMDVVVTPNGNRIGGTFWTRLLRCRSTIEKFQVHQVALNSIIIKYQAQNQLSTTDREYFINEINAKCGDDIEIMFDKIDRFNKSNNGKHRIVISEL